LNDLKKQIILKENSLKSEEEVNQLKKILESKEFELTDLITKNNQLTEQLLIQEELNKELEDLKNKLTQKETELENLKKFSNEDKEKIETLEKDVRLNKIVIEQKEDHIKQLTTAEIPRLRYMNNVLIDENRKLLEMSTEEKDELKEKYNQYQEQSTRKD
jgi:hypothetical protein